MTYIKFFFELNSILVFYHYVIVLLSSGLSFKQVMQTLSSYSKQFNRYVDKVNEQIDMGHSLVYALQFLLFKYKGCIISYSCAIPDISLWLEGYHQFLLSLFKHIKQVLSLLIYPIILSVFSVFLFFLLIFYMVPLLEAQYQMYGVNLPSIFSFFLFINVLFYDYGFFFLILSCFFLMSISLVSARIFRPIILFILYPFFILELLWAFSILLQHGFSIKEIVDSISYSKDHLFYYRFNAFKSFFYESSDFSLSFSNYFLSHEMYRVLLQTAERSHSLDQVFDKIISIYEDQFFSKLKLGVSFVQPFLLCFIGIIVVVMFYVCFVPIITVMEEII